jgi:hypothetical protein
MEHPPEGLSPSTKFPGAWRVHPSPHVIVFAPFEPDVNNFSPDRFDVRWYFDCHEHEDEDTLDGRGRFLKWLSDNSLSFKLPFENDGCDFSFDFE